MPAIRTLHAAPPFDELRDLAAAASTDDPALRESVAAIVRDVATRGDDALLEYTARFDRLEVAHASALRVGADELAEAADAIEPELLGLAARRRIQHPRLPREAARARLPGPARGRERARASAWRRCAAWGSTSRADALRIRRPC
jgi:histidinol dehydrogenase